jgi:hypothetical protein
LIINIWLVDRNILPYVWSFIMEDFEYILYRQVHTTLQCLVFCITRNIVSFKKMVIANAVAPLWYV